MTPNKSAEEIAREIAKRIVAWFPDGEETDQDQATNIIATALREFGDARLEEAAKVLESRCQFEGCEGRCGDHAIAIRALKSVAKDEGGKA